MNNKKYFKSNEYKTYDKMRLFGNKAAHPGTLNETIKPFHYDDEDLKDILDCFNQMMRYLNEHANKKT